MSIEDEIEIKKENSQVIEISEDLKNLVMARLDVLPSDRRIYIGDESKAFDKKELIKQVKEGTEIGKKIIALELTFLRALKEGTFLEEIIRA